MKHKFKIIDAASGEKLKLGAGERRNTLQTTHSDLH